MRPDVHFKRVAAAALFAGLGAVSPANAQFLPNINQLTATTNAATTTDDNNSQTNAATTGQSGSTGTTATDTGNVQTTKTGTSNSGTNTGATSGTNTGRTTQTTGTNTNTGRTTGTTSGSAVTTTGTFPSNPLSTSSTKTGNGIVISNAPTLQGVGIPTMIVPYTANAPFMKKSSLPEGTVFIAVGAVLAFMAVCVIAWRAIVAWSINRSVKRAAMASILAAETKSPGGWASNPFKPSGGFYSQAPGGSTHSLGDHYGSSRNEKSARASMYRNPLPSTGSGLFFSPTASNAGAQTTSIPMMGLQSSGAHSTGNRSSTYLPAGYYASPSAQIGGGAGVTTIGTGSVPPFAQPTGGNSPIMNPRRHSLHRPLSHVQLAPPSRGGTTERMPSQGLRPISGLQQQASANSLRVATGHGEDGVRAPSAYLEDLFEGHGNPAVPPPLPQQQHHHHHR